MHFVYGTVFLFFRVGYCRCIETNTKGAVGMAEKKSEKKYVNNALAWCLLGAEVLVICIICLIVFM